MRVDPRNYDQLHAFKAAVYDEYREVDSWIDDAKLDIVWREAHDKEIPDHLQPLVKD